MLEGSTLGILEDFDILGKKFPLYSNRPHTPHPRSSISKIVLLITVIGWAFHVRVRYLVAAAGLDYIMFRPHSLNCIISYASYQLKPTIELLTKTVLESYLELYLVFD